MREAPGKDYKVFLHLVRPGQIAQVAQADSEPVSGYGHTSWWQAGELIVDEHEWTIDKAVPAGKYEVLVGLYESSTMRNLAATGAQEIRPGDRVVLTQVEVIR